MLDQVPYDDDGVGTCASPRFHFSWPGSIVAYSLEAIDAMESEEEVEGNRIE
jgi:hypothetical protein